MAERNTLVQPLAVDDLCVVQEELYETRTHWYNMGLKLGLKPDVLDAIKSRCFGDPRECFLEMLKDYLKTSTPSWRTLVEALRSPTVGQQQLAKKVEQKYCPALKLQTPDHEVMSETENELHSFAMQISPSSPLSSDEQHLPKNYGCGCGGCTFDTLFDKGCRKPIPSMSSFSYLNTEGLNASQKRILRGRLYREFEKITTDFGSLVYRTYESLIKQGITVQQLVCLLGGLDAFQPTVRKRPLLEDRIEELQAADSIDKVFLILRGYMSFFSHHIIEYIILEFGTQQDKENLHSYTTKLTEYSRRSVFECPTYSLARKDEANLIVKLEGVVFERYNLTHLAVLESRISNIIKVAKYTLRLCTVEKGCLQLTFQMPHFVKEVMFPLTDSQKAALQVEGVIRLTCEDYQCSLKKTPTSPEIREPVDSRFTVTMSAQHGPKPAPRRTQPNHPEQLQGQHYPYPPQPSQPGTNGHYDRPPPNPRPSYPDGQQYMPLLPTQPKDPEDNQYVSISDRPQPQVLPSPGTTAQPRGDYTPLQPTSSPADEDNGYMVLVSASTRPQPRPRPAPRQHYMVLVSASTRPQPRPRPAPRQHYSVLEGPTSSDKHAPPSASNRSQSLTDAQRNYVAPDSPGVVAETIEEHEYVDPDTMDCGTASISSPPVDSRNYVEANRAPMIGEDNYIEPDSNPAVDRGNSIGSHPGPPVAPRIHDNLLPVDDRNYIFQEAIGSQPRPQPRLAPPSPRQRSGMLAASSGAQGADVYKMIENFSPSQVDMLMQMLQKVQVQTQTQTREDVEAAWDTSPGNPLYDSRAPGTNQRNLQRLTGCLSHAPVLTENILVTDDDDPESYEARPEWAKAVTVPQGSNLDSLAALEQEALLIPRDQLTDFKQIGEGQFGKVFKASLSRGEQSIPVAVKTTQKSTSEADKASFLKEMSVMSQMMHPNIVRLYGLVQEDVPAPWIVLEYLPHGDLKHFLMKNERPLEKLIKYMIDVAMGMHYISERGLVHGDLAARNILVGDGELCKVAGFGLLRELPKDDSIYQAQTDVPCPIRWMPPESISQRRFSTASDVWSFGILIWEMFNPGKQPYDNLRNLECVTKVAQGYRLPSPRGCPRLIARIMKACWHEKPEKRPSFLLISTLLSTKVTFDK